MIEYPEYSTQTLYLQELCNKYGDFKVAYAFKNSEGDMIWSKHKSVMQLWQEENWWMLSKVNNRTILPNEIILDIDDDTERKRLNKLKKINTFLEFSGVYHKMYFTGSKGYHVHILLNKELTPDERKFYTKKFKVDELKISTRVMIALEFAPHWKTGRQKTEITNKLFRGKDEQ